jgi:endonuclease G
MQIKYKLQGINMKKLGTLFTLLFVTIIANAQKTVTIDKKYYQVIYSETLKQPIAVDYGIRTKTCNATRAGMDFFAEKGVITSSNADYANNDWDKGHLAPAADFCFSRDAMLSTFSYANCALQHYKLNRGVWKELEALEREWAKTDSIIIHIDVIFSKSPTRTPTGASIPAAFRKTITFYSTKKKLVYEFPNVPPTKTLDKYLIKN